MGYTSNYASKALEESGGGKKPDLKKIKQHRKTVKKLHNVEEKAAEKTGRRGYKLAEKAERLRGKAEQQRKDVI